MPEQQAYLHDFVAVRDVLIDTGIGSQRIFTRLVLPYLCYPLDQGLPVTGIAPCHEGTVARNIDSTISETVRGGCHRRPQSQNPQQASQKPNRPPPQPSTITSHSRPQNATSNHHTKKTQKEQLLWMSFDMIGIAEGGARTHDLEVDLFAVIRATRSTD
jgi:hypothetical protein